MFCNRSSWSVNWSVVVGKTMVRFVTDEHLQFYCKTAKESSAFFFQLDLVRSNRFIPEFLKWTLPFLNLDFNGPLMQIGILV